MPELDEAGLRQLVQQAFDAAKEKGKPQWGRMTLPVLRNRMLQMTDNNFAMSVYGAQNLREVLAPIRDLVQVDHSTKPVTAVLVAAPEDAKRIEAGTKHGSTIRDDLWKAILDYSSGLEYEWDASVGLARPVEHADPQRRLPTLTREGMNQWRLEFSQSAADELSPEDKDRLASWQIKGLPTVLLPWSLRPKWNAFLTARASKSLEDWFKTQGLKSTASLSLPLESSQKASSESEEVARYRKLIIEYISLASEAELHSILIPASLLLKSSAQPKDKS